MTSIRLASPSVGDAELDAVREVFASGMLTLGPALARFENLVAAISGVPHAIGCANGTAALHLSLLALNIGPGDEVVVPAYTFPATANVVRLVGATPVFCDVDEGLDVTSASHIEAVLTHRTRAIMVVHLFGYPVDMGPVMALADDRGLPVIEDAAGALGATVGGQAAGSIGAAGCFSFHPRKVVTCGEGGAVTTNDQAMSERLRRLRHHGMGPEGFAEIGLNYRLSDILAAVAVPQLERFATTLDATERLARRYDAGLRRIDGVDPAPNDERQGSRHGRQAYVSRVSDASRRDVLIGAIRAAGVECQIGTYCVPQLRPYAELGYSVTDTPNAVASAAAGLALPLYPALGDDGVDEVLSVVEHAVRST